MQVNSVVYIISNMVYLITLTPLYVTIYKDLVMLFLNPQISITFVKNQKIKIFILIF